MNRGWWAAGATALAVAAGISVGRERAPAAPTPGEQLATLSGSIDFFQQRWNADPINTLAAGHLAERLLLRFQLGAEMADLRRAEEVAREVLPVTTDPAGAHARLARILLMEHDFAGAWTEAERALAYPGDHQDALASRFDAGMATGRYAEARTALGGLAPGSLPREVRAAHWLAFGGESDAAAASLERVCRRLEGGAYRAQMVAWCLVELAGVERQRGDEPGAHGLLRRALELQPGYRGAAEGLADEAHAAGEWRRAVRLYGQIASDAHPDLYLRLAEAEVALGDTAAALRHRAAFLRLATAPGAEALNSHPLALFLAERTGAAARDQALAVALRDVEHRPSVESYDVLSWVRLRRGELREALAASDRARAHGSPSPTMHFHRGRILAALGRTAEADSLLRRAAADPGLLEPHARLALAAR